MAGRGISVAAIALACLTFGGTASANPWASLAKSDVLAIHDFLRDNHPGPPDPANPLLKLPNVVLSPHNAAAPLECNEKMSIRAARNMLELFDGVLDPGFVVNPETLPNRRNV